MDLECCVRGERPLGERCLYAVRRTGAVGLLVPSAALAGAINLMIYRDGLAAGIDLAAGGPHRILSAAMDLQRECHLPRCSLLKKTAASGGSVTVSECGRPWARTGAASTPPKLPHPLPP